MSSSSSPVPSAPAPANDAARHALFEDILALLVGTLLVSLGVTLYKESGLLSGGVAGAAFLAHYATGVSFGLAFFLLNLPFYWLAVRRMGWPFTLKTFSAVGLLSVFTAYTPMVFSIQSIHPAYASILGGIVLGTGFLVLFRHRSSLGGVGIVAVYAQERYGWRAGHIQMAVDCAIVLSAFFVMEPSRIAWSILGAVVLNLILSLNHKPGRYLGF
jgi:uncharacterized membrane-anchored protein YitT (DUF2179 family)